MARQGPADVTAQVTVQVNVTVIEINSESAGTTMQNMTAHHNRQVTWVEDHGLPMPQRAGRAVWMSSAKDKSGEQYRKVYAQKLTAGEMDNPFASLSASATNLASDSFNECRATVLSNTRLNLLSLEQMLVGRGNPASFPPSSNIRWAGIRKTAKTLTNLNPDPTQPRTGFGTNRLSLEQMLVGRGNPANFPPSFKVGWA
ncbi:MAG: hypothetical protein HRT35_27725, partial [Algicola sp.]|nr:hypothetical protein [Algicola sp.]